MFPFQISATVVGWSKSEQFFHVGYSVKQFDSGLKNDFQGYEEALQLLNMKSLQNRREYLSLKFAKNCLKNEKIKNFFPINQNNIKRTRNHELFKVNFANRKRYASSVIPTLQRKLNSNELENRKLLRSFGT